MEQRGCLMKCGYDDDNLMHYLRCSVFWKFVNADRPLGLGIKHKRDIDIALLVSHRLNEEEVVRLAVGLYALYRTVNYLRFDVAARGEVDTMRLLQNFTKRAVDHSRVGNLFRYAALRRDER